MKEEEKNLGERKELSLKYPTRELRTVSLYSVSLDFLAVTDSVHVTATCHEPSLCEWRGEGSFFQSGIMYFTTACYLTGNRCANDTEECLPRSFKQGTCSSCSLCKRFGDQVSLLSHHDFEMC